MRRCRPGAGLWWIHSSVVVSCLWCLFRKHVALTLSLSNTHLSHPPPALAPARSLSARTRIRHPALTKALVLAAVPEGYRVFEAPEARRTDPWASPAGHKSRDLATRLTMSVRRGHLPPGALPKPYTYTLHPKPGDAFPRASLAVVQGLGVGVTGGGCGLSQRGAAVARSREACVSLPGPRCRLLLPTTRATATDRASRLILGGGGTSVPIGCRLCR